MTGPGRFAFIDEGEAVRRLGIDRATLLGWVAEGRLRAYPGVGKGSFFRAGDVEKLARESAAAREAEEAPAEDTGSGRKQHDPAYRVHLRIQADLKWLDIPDDDLKAWVRELHPAAYEKNRSNITRIEDKLNRLLALMDEAAENWRAQGQMPPRD